MKNKLVWHKTDHDVFGKNPRFTMYVCDVKCDMSSQPSNGIAGTASDVGECAHVRAEVEGKIKFEYSASVYTRRQANPRDPYLFVEDKILLPRTRLPTVQAAKQRAEEFLIARYDDAELPWREGTDEYEKYIRPRIERDIAAHKRASEAYDKNTTGGKQGVSTVVSTSDYLGEVVPEIDDDPESDDVPQVTLNLPAPTVLLLAAAAAGMSKDITRSEIERSIANGAMLLLVSALLNAKKERDDVVSDVVSDVVGDESRQQMAQ